MQSSLFSVMKRFVLLGNYIGNHFEEYTQLVVLLAKINSQVAMNHVGSSTHQSITPTLIIYG